MRLVMIVLVVLVLSSFVYAAEETQCNQEVIVALIESNHKATRTDNHDYIDNKIGQFETDTEQFMNTKMVEFENIIDSNGKRFMIILMIGVFGLTFLINGLFGLLRLKKEKKILLALNDNLTKTNQVLSAFLHEFKKKVF